MSADRRVFVLAHPEARRRAALVRAQDAEIQRLRAELQHARDGLTKGRSRMREDLERHKPLVQAVEWVVEEGYMHVEDLARLRAALDGLRPNVGANRETTR